jgi:peptide/nickel transport system permease protein
MLNTFILVLPGVTFAYIIGTAFGAVMGSNRGSDLEQYGTIPLVIVGMIPEFFTAILLVVFFAQILGWFPSFGIADIATLNSKVWWKQYLTMSFAHHYILPFTAVVLRYLYLPTLLMRTSVIEVSGQDFISYHRLTGLPRAKQLRHVVRHAILPVITAYPVSTVKAISGLVLIEIVFNWPGIGAKLVAAVFARDFPVVQFIFFSAAAFVIIMNYAVDLLYGYIDPRVSIED